MEKTGRKWDVRSFIKHNNMYVIFAALLVVCVFMSEEFMKGNNLMNIGRQQAGHTMIYMGLLYLIGYGAVQCHGYVLPYNA